VRVTASNAGGSSSVLSAATAVVQEPPANALLPSISGTTEVGSTLTSTAGSWTGSAPPAYSYQWQRCGLYRAAVLGDGPLGYWRLGEAGGTTAADASGNGRSGAYTGGFTLGATDALSADPDGAAAFDGVSGVVTVPGIGDGAVASGFTLEAWVRAEGRQTDRGIAGKWGYHWSTGGGGILLWLDVAGNYGLAVTSDHANYLSTTVAPTPGKWEHVVGTWDGATLSLYLNGTLLASRPFAGNPGSHSAEFQLGGYGVNAARYLNGALDEVALYGRALSAPEVQEHHAARSLWCADIAGATGNSYTLAPADAHASVRAVVTATNTAGSASATSEPSAAVAPARPPVETMAPALSGSTEDAQTLSASSGSWTGTEPFAHAYRWQRCDGTGGACADISGATGTTYSLKPADVGSTIRVVVTTSNIAGSASATSSATAAVRAAPPGNLVQPKVVGGAEEGLMLTAAEGRWSGTPSLAFTYRWQRCDTDGVCADIPSATNPTYLLVAADLGATVQVIVTATNAAGAAAATSPRTAAVAPAPVLTGFSTRQHWPYAAGVPRFWTDRSPAGPAIAIVDSGIQAERADFGGRVVKEVTLTTLTPNSPGDGRGHGTFVASIAAGEAVGYTGADPSATLVSIDVLNDEGRALTSDVIAAADWIYANKALYDIRVANFSLQGSVESSFRFDPVNKAVEKLWLSGVVVVAAAGNYAVDGQESGVRFTPGNDPFVITVGATDVNGSVSSADDFAAPWSAYGYTVDGFAKPELGAPGRYMVGAVPPTSSLATERPDRIVADGYMQLSGTSFAAPIVAGAAAALLAAHPTWTPDQVKGALMLAADPTAALQLLSTGVGEIDAPGAADLIDPPNPNAALNQFLIADPLGGPVQVFDAAGWAATAETNPAWASAHWGSAHWGSASWSVAHWGSASWSSAHWGSAHWGSAHWGSDTAPSSADAHWGSITDRAAADALPAGGYWITNAERAAAEQALGRVPAP
jgi:serine protease AprX